MSKKKIAHSDMWRDGKRVAVDYGADASDLLHDLRLEMPEFAALLSNDHSDDPYGIPMVSMASLLLALHKAKDAQYGSSWAKRGAVGVYHNIMRKADRIQRLLEQLDITAQTSMMSSVSQDDTIDKDAVYAAFVDTLGDLANYCMMWMCYIAATDSETFEGWLRDSWCSSTGVAYDEIKKYID